MQIAWKQGSHHTVDPQVAYEVIEKVREKNKGEVTAEALVAAAKAKRNPLHPEFTWDDSEAANEHRLEQARRVLRSLVVIRDDLSTDRPQRQYEVIRKPQEASEDGKRERDKYAYRTMEDIMADPDHRAELLGRALRELISIRTRFRDLQELAVVLRAIDEVIESVK